MKRIFICLLIFIFIFINVTVFAASVDPIKIGGNDIDKRDEITPAGCVFYSFGNNENPGTYTVRFNCDGMVDPEGELVFSITIGTQPGNDFTEVLSWESNFEVYAVTVKGGPDFNLYVYNTATGDDQSGCPGYSSRKACKCKPYFFNILSAFLYTNTYSHTYAYSYGYTYTNAYGDSYTDTYSYSNTYSNSYAYTMPDNSSKAAQAGYQVSYMYINSLTCICHRITTWIIIMQVD